MTDNAVVGNRADDKMLLVAADRRRGIRAEVGIPLAGGIFWRHSVAVVTEIDNAAGIGPSGTEQQYRQHQNS
jgi:hypothetical protein